MISPRRAILTALGLIVLVSLASFAGPSRQTAPSPTPPGPASPKEAPPASAPAPAPEAPSRDLSKLKAASQPHGTMFTYKGGADDVSAYMVKPSGAGAHPAIIVIHEWWGLNDQIKGVADLLASKGYIAVAPDLYRGKVTSDPKVAMDLMGALPDARAKQDLTSLFSYLQGNASVKSHPIGSIGFCMGGGLSLMLAAAEPDLGACVACYGRPISDPAQMRKVHAPILGIYGGADTGIPTTSVEAFKTEMTKLGKSVETKTYPGAGHGFMNPNNPTSNAEAAADAWTRIDAFFKAHMPPDGRTGASGRAPSR